MGDDGKMVTLLRLVPPQAIQTPALLHHACNWADDAGPDADGERLCFIDFTKTGGRKHTLHVNHSKSNHGFWLNEYLHRMVSD